jgi:hypothetical protein
MRRPSTTIRNTRKHFVRCVDCSTQTLPQHASAQRPWATAAALRIPGRNNEGALCFECGNKRKALLGLTVEQDDNRVLETKRHRPSCPIETAPRRVRVNKREHTWEVGSLHSLIAKWKDVYAYSEYKNREMDLKKWVVLVNNKQISPEDFGSMPVVDGDEISIVSGCLLHPF